MAHVGLEWSVLPGLASLGTGRPPFGRLVGLMAENVNYLGGWRMLRMVHHIAPTSGALLPGGAQGFFATQTLRLRWTTSSLATNVLIFCDYNAQDPAGGAITENINASVWIPGGGAATDIGCEWDMASGSLPSTNISYGFNVFPGRAESGFEPLTAAQVTALGGVATPPRPLNVSADTDTVIIVVGTDVNIASVSALEIYNPAI